MMGDRFGYIVKIDPKTKLIHVKMDRSKKTLKCQEDHLLNKDPTTDHGFLY